MKLISLFFGFYFLTFSLSCLADSPIIRIGSQATGTVDWELAVLQDMASNDFRLEIHHLANAEAGKIALQSNAVDMIVSDWFWVSRMRAEGTDLSFYPYSSISGALMVAKASPIQSIEDLSGKRLGIAGGELDKNWLLLQALAKQKQLNLTNTVEKVFGAPPLINELLKQNQIDAALTYWHFAARLEAQGYRRLIDGKNLLKTLGINEELPTVGYVFRQSWAKSHQTAITSFFAASKQAKSQLCNNETSWKKILPLLKAEDAASQSKLRLHYCEGDIKHWGEPEQQAAKQLYTIMKTLTGDQLTGKSEQIQPGTFWTGE